MKFQLVLICFFLFSCIKENEGNISLSIEKNFFKVKSVNFFKTDKLLGLEELTKLAKENKFSVKTGEYMSFGITQDFVYLYFDIEREDQSEWILELPYPPLIKIHFYQIDKYENEYFQESGISFPSDKKYSEHPYYQFPIIQQTGKIKIFLLIRAGDPLTTPIFLWNKNTLGQIDGYRHFAFGIFFGIILSLALYNFLLFYTINDRAYLYYICYILSFGFFLFFMYGYAGYVYRDFLVRFETRFIPFFAILTSVFASLFSRRFLNINRFSSRLNKSLQYIIGIGIGILVIYFYIPQKIVVILANVHPIVASVFIISSSIVAIKNSYKPAVYFLIAWSGLFISVFLYIGSNLTILPSNFFTYYMQLPGVAFEAILLSLALGYRINDLRIREEEAKQDTLKKEIASREQQEKLSKSFKRFVPDEFLKNLNKESILDIRQGDSVACKMAVLFTDIRGFTNFSEKLEPEKVFIFINKYLEQMEPIIQKYDGFIDKFIGDAIMALFPNENKALLAGIEMIFASSQVYLPDKSTLEIGIGIHSGELILGTIGSPSRLDTTVIGDTVNLASRIENLNKEYGTKLLVSEEVIKNSNQDAILFREIDLVRVKGKEKPIFVYEVFGKLD